jgi:DNA-binding response OmpR family regulator
MAETAFQGVNGILADRDKGFRHTLYSMLRPMGFMTLAHTDNLDEIRDAVSENRVDLVVADVNVGEERLLELVRRLRHQEIGVNPFIVVIVLAADPHPETVHRIIDSGTDALLVKPVAAGALIDRLKYLSANRKGFVVTTDYVGPDRRSAPRPGTQQIPLIAVPNPLSSADRSDGNAYHKAIEAAIREINEQKVQRHAFQIGYLVNRIAPAYLMGDPVDDIRADLERLLMVADDLVRRLPDSQCAHMVKVCVSVRQIAERVHARMEKPDVEDVRRMPELATQLRKGCEAAAAASA